MPLLFRMFPLQAFSAFSLIHVQHLDILCVCVCVCVSKNVWCCWTEASSVVKCIYAEQVFFRIVEYHIWPQILDTAYCCIPGAGNNIESAVLKWTRCMIHLAWYHVFIRESLNATKEISMRTTSSEESARILGCVYILILIPRIKSFFF